MEIVVEKDVMVAMRDGVELATDVYRPAVGGPFPTLVERIPYNKEIYGLVSGWLDVLRAAREGFAVVVQDTRGRYRSGGTFRPFFDEGADGADTVAWAAGQGWSTGSVGMFGSSYTGATQWLAAAERPRPWPPCRRPSPVVTSMMTGCPRAARSGWVSPSSGSRHRSASVNCCGYLGRD